MTRHSPEGRIEVICGSMFSGKTETLISRIIRATYARLPVVVFKPVTDTRSEDTVESHSKRTRPALNIPHDNPSLILDLVGEAKVVGIEEAQFFTPAIVDVVEKLVWQGKRVIIAGLEIDSMGKPFGSMPHLLAISDQVDKLTAACTICGEDANRSQRLVPSTELVMIGAADKYAARCRKHFIPVS